MSHRIRPQAPSVSPQKLRGIARAIMHSALKRPLLPTVRRQFDLSVADAVAAIRLANQMRAAAVRREMLLATPRVTRGKPGPKGPRKKKETPPAMETGSASLGAPCQAHPESMPAQPMPQGQPP